MKTTLKLAVLIGLGALAANQASANLIINGNFESGDLVGFTSGYGDVTSTSLGLSIGGNPPGTGEGQYAVGNDAHFYHSAFTSAGDHTSGSGNMMIVNGSTFPNMNVWSGTLSSPLVAGQTYLFSAWVMNVYHDGQTGHEDGNIEFSIGGTSLGSITAPDLGVWHQFTFTYTAPSGGELPTAVDLAQNSYANDFALDDMSLVAVPEPTTMVAGAGALGLALLGIGRARRSNVVRIGK